MMHTMVLLESMKRETTQAAPPGIWCPARCQRERRVSLVLKKQRQRNTLEGLREPLVRLQPWALAASQPLLANIPEAVRQLPDWLDYAAQLSPMMRPSTTPSGWRPQVFLPLRATVFGWLAENSARAFGQIALPAHFSLPQLKEFLQQEADVARHCAGRCEALESLGAPLLQSEDWVRNLQMMALDNLKTVLNLRLQAEEASLPIVWVGSAKTTHQVYLGVRRVVLADTDVVSLRLDDPCTVPFLRARPPQVLTMPFRLLEQPQAQSLWAALMVPLHLTSMAFFASYSELCKWNQQQLPKPLRAHGTVWPRLVGTLRPLAANFRSTCVVENFDLGMRSRLALRLAQAQQAPLTATPATERALLTFEEEAARLGVAIRAAELQAVRTVLQESAP
jgi:hypothetical protein